MEKLTTTCNQTPPPLAELSADEIAFILDKLNNKQITIEPNYSIRLDSPVVSGNYNSNMVSSVMVKSENDPTYYTTTITTNSNNNSMSSNDSDSKRQFNGNSKRKASESVSSSCDSVKGHFCMANGVSESEIGKISCKQTARGKRVIIDLDIAARRRLDFKGCGLMVFYRDRWLPTFDYVNDEALSLIELVISHPNTQRYDGLINHLKKQGYGAYDKLYIESSVCPRINDKRVASHVIHIDGIPTGQTRCLTIDLRDQ